MNAMPKIKPELSRLDRLLERAGEILLVAFWVLAFYIFIQLPATIPIHYNARGVADGYGSKAVYFILPVMATVLYFTLTALNKYPHIFNYMVKITAENAAVQYGIATRMLRLLKLALLIVFSLILLFIYLTAKGIDNNLGIWLMPIISALTLIPVVIGAIQSVQKDKKSL